MDNYPQEENVLRASARVSGLAAVEGTSPTKLPLSQQANLIEDLNKTIEQFAIRLNPVLTPQYEERSDVNKKDGDGAEQLLSPLTVQLSANNMRIAQASKNLRSLIERLEC